MAKEYDIITALDMCVDFLVHLGGVIPEFGQKEQIIRDYEVELGGSCGIFACQAAKLEMNTKGIGVAGADAFGALVLQKLVQAGVKTDSIRTDRFMKTGMGAALCKEDGDRAILTYLGTIDGVSPEDMTRDILESTRHVHVGSYYLMKKLQSHYPDILTIAKKAGATVSLDTNWDPDEVWDGGIWDVLPYVDIFMGNEYEACAITRKDAIKEAIEVLSGKVPIIAIKMGEKGAAVYTDGKEYMQPALKVKVVDTVGAGDSFDAGFVYGFLNRYDWQKCLQIGCLCGSYNTTRAGGISGQLKREQLHDLLDVL